MTDNPRPAYERQSAFVRLHYRGDDNVKAGPVDMFPVDANEAIARDPKNWSRKPFDNAAPEEQDDPGEESRQSAHGNTPEEIYENDEMTAMRKDGLAAEPAGSKKGRRPGAYTPGNPSSRRHAPVMIVDPAEDQTEGRGNDPKSGDKNIAANRDYDNEIE